MDEEKMDVIIVGGGIAGLAAARILAENGLMVLLIERGSYCGAKNVSGGKLYSAGLEEIFPGLESSGALERRIVRERVFCRDADKGYREVSCEGVDVVKPEGAAYSVLRARLDAWLSEQVEESGAMLINNICVTGLMVEDGRVCGVVAGDEEMAADVVILAEGVNGLLAKELGLRAELEPSETCVGVKEVLEMDGALIEERFHLNPGEGAEYMFLQDGREPLFDGFLYTNRESVSVGVEVCLSDLESSGMSVPEMLEAFKARPEIACLIQGGRLSEYSAHLVSRKCGGPLGRLYGDGVLLVGDTAGLVANFGSVIRGMDLAAESGRLAAETVLEASAAGDYSAQRLSVYQQKVADGIIGKTMAACKGGRNGLEEKVWLE